MLVLPRTLQASLHNDPAMVPLAKFEGEEKEDEPLPLSEWQCLPMVEESAGLSLKNVQEIQPNHEVLERSGAFCPSKHVLGLGL